LVLTMVVACGAAIGCESKDKGATLAPSASALAPSTPPPSSMTTKLVIDPKGTSSIDMPAPKLRITATTDAAAGTLDVDVANLASSRGEVKIDLSTLTTKTYADDPSKNVTQTAHARCWLEVADCEEGKLADDLKAKNKYAVYAIRSIEGASATDLGKVTPTEEGGESVRTVTLTTKGELLVHGRKVDRDAEIEAQFRYAPGAKLDKPKSLIIKTKKPLRVTLAEHDVKPRDRVGQIAKASFHLLGTKVADVADISLDLRAAPQP
jgi:hypothetical protein